jgi:hypothetical protein
MRRFLAFVLILACAFAAHALPLTMRRAGTRGLPMLKPIVAFSFRSVSSLPGCTAADSCVLDCYATASAWECYKPDGTAVAVTQGTGTTFVSTPWGYAAQIDADAEAPTISAATMEALLPGGSAAFYEGAYSVFALANPGVFATVSNHALWAQYSAAGGTSAYNDANSLYVRHAGSATMGQGIPSNARGRWVAAIGSVSAAGAPTARVAGAENNTTTGTGAITSITTPFYFGRLDPVSGAGNYLDGYLARLRMYSKALSATERATLERQAFGAVGSGGREMSPLRASTAWMEAADGYVYAIGSNLPLIHGTYGFLAEEVSTNLLKYSTAFDNAIWLKGQSGSTLPVVTANAAEAPDRTMTADRIDFGATTNETDYSIISQLPGNAVSAHSASVYLRTVSGSGTLYLGIIRSGAGTDVKSIACAVTTAWSRCEVRGASVTLNNGNVIMGPWSYDATQPNAQPALSVYVWGAQFEALAFSTSVIPTGSVAVQRAAMNMTIPIVGAQLNNIRSSVTGRWIRPETWTTFCQSSVLFDATDTSSTPPGIFGAYNYTGSRFICDGRRHVSPSYPTMATPTAGVDYRLVCERREDWMYARQNAGAQFTSSAVATTRGDKTMPTARIGSYGTSGGCGWGGYIRDLEIGP